MAKSDTITVYWAPANYNVQVQSQHLMYPRPESILSFIHGNKAPDSVMQRCPAMKDTLDNVYVFKAAVDDKFSMKDADLTFDFTKNPDDFQFLNVDSKMGVYKPRPSQLQGYTDVAYNLSWCLYASEPLVAKFSAPYYPPITPVRGALLAPGEFDIGRWFRPWNLDYHVPIGESEFEVRAGDPMFFVQFKTDKKIVFKRFEYSSELGVLGMENAKSHKLLPQGTSLETRYTMAEEALQREMVMKYINQNLIE